MYKKCKLSVFFGGLCLLFLPNVQGATSFPDFRVDAYCIPMWFHVQHAQKNLEWYLTVN